jgi:hypothetical protein
MIGTAWKGVSGLTIEYAATSAVIGVVRRSEWEEFR